MLSSLGYHGMIDIELIDCGGTIYFNEMNFRNSGVSYGVTQAGVNLPAMLVRHLTGRGLPGRSRPNCGTDSGSCTTRRRMRMFCSV